MRTIVSFSTGYGLAEITCIDVVDPEDWRVESERDMLLAVAQLLPPGTPARLVDVAVALWAGTDSDSSFESGIDLILAGAGMALERSTANR